MPYPPTSFLYPPLLTVFPSLDNLLLSILGDARDPPRRGRPRLISCTSSPDGESAGGGRRPPPNDKGANEGLSTVYCNQSLELMTRSYSALSRNGFTSRDKETTLRDVFEFGNIQDVAELMILLTLCNIDDHELSLYNVFSSLNCIIQA